MFNFIFPRTFRRVFVGEIRWELGGRGERRCRMAGWRSGCSLDQVTVGLWLHLLIVSRLGLVRILLADHHFSGAALGGVPVAVQAAEEGGQQAQAALVHTSYFEDSGVRNLIALHIVNARSRPESVGNTGEDNELQRWLDTHLTKTRERYAEFSTSVEK